MFRVKLHPVVAIGGGTTNSWEMVLSRHSRRRRFLVGRKATQVDLSPVCLSMCPEADYHTCGQGATQHQRTSRCVLHECRGCRSKGGPTRPLSTTVSFRPMTAVWAVPNEHTVGRPHCPRCRSCSGSRFPSPPQATRAIPNLPFDAQATAKSDQSPAPSSAELWRLASHTSYLLAIPGRIRSFFSQLRIGRK